ncbi:MAG: MarR family winged helix-turn-helix transcriptional regulator [Alphaproteobacteria bacterium]
MTRSGLKETSDTADSTVVDLTGLTGLLGYQIRQAQTASFRDLQERFRELGITPGEFSLLTIVRDNPQIRQTDLVHVYGLDKSTLSVAVKRLVERGLVEPRKLPDDRRFHGLSLTTEGQAALATVTAIIADQENRMEAVLSAGEREILMTALRRIAATLSPD